MATTTKAEQMFREKTIQTLTRVETQLAQLVEAHADERAARRQIEADIAAKLKDHDESDDRHFQRITKAQEKIEKKIYMAAGGLAAITFIIQYFR
jgi:hypothetical protein